MYWTDANQIEPVAVNEQLVFFEYIIRAFVRVEDCLSQGCPAHMLPRNDKSDLFYYDNCIS